MADEHSKIISEELLYAIVQVNLDAIICFKTLFNDAGNVSDFMFRFLNDTCFNYLPGSPEDYLEKTFLHVFADKNGEGLIPAFIDVAESGGSKVYELNFHRIGLKGWFKVSILKYKDGLLVHFREINERKKHELELRKALREKENAIREVHHRVKNNFQIIASLLNLEEQNIENSECKRLINVTRNRIRTVSYIHDILHKSNSNGTVNLGEYVNELVNNLLTMIRDENKSISLSTTYDEVLVSSQVALNMGLIINELVTNSIKYAFPENQDGIIKTCIRETNNHLYVSVEDNGTGIPQDNKVHEQKSLGMQIVGALAEQLNAKMEIIRDSGTRINIYWKKEKP